MARWPMVWLRGAWQDASKTPQTPKLATLESAMSMAPRYQSYHQKMACFWLMTKVGRLTKTTFLRLRVLLPFFFGGVGCVL